MYGYDRKSEYTRLRAVAELGKKLYDKLISPTMQNYGTKSKGERLSDVKQLQLLDALAQLHAAVAHDGKTWQQYPYDMLARIAMVGKDTDEERRAAAFALCSSWEITAAMLSYADKMRRLYDTCCRKLAKEQKAKQQGNLPDAAQEDQAEDGPDAIDRMLRDKEALQNFAELQAELDRQRKENRFRVTYDVFDQKISFNERIARWQEDDSLLHQPENSGHVALPEMFYSDTVQRYTPDDKWMDLAVFSCMLYRHLKAMGVTAQKLEEKDNRCKAHDYWVLAGGGEGFGLYQRRVQPESFFKHVKEAADALKSPPVRLVAVNDVWMAWMSPAAYRAFEAAEEAAAKQQAPDAPEMNLPDIKLDEPLTDNDAQEYEAWKKRCADALGRWTKVTRQPAQMMYTEADPHTGVQRSYLHTVDDGGLSAATALHDALAEMKKKSQLSAAKEDLLYRVFSASESQGAEIWQSADETVKNGWITCAADYLQKAANKPETEGKTVGCDLRMMGSAKNWKENAARLLLGYLAWCNSLQYACGMDEISEKPATALAGAFAEDSEGKQYQAYCQAVANGNQQLQIGMSIDGQLKLALCSRAETAAVEAHKSILHSLLQDVQEQSQWQPNGQEYQAEQLNRLFADISAYLLAADKLHGKIDLESVLLRDTKNRLANDAKAVFMLVLQWWLHRGAGHALKKCTLMPDANGAALTCAERKGQQLTPFSGDTDARAFVAYMADISKRRILRALKVSKAKADSGVCYQACLSSVSGKISDEEQTVLDAVMLQAGKDTLPDAAAYKERLAALDCRAINSLLEKGINVLRENGGAAYGSAQLIRLPSDNLSANDRLLRFLLPVLLYKLAGGQKLLHEEKFTLAAEGDSGTGAGQCLALQMQELSGLRAYLEYLYARVKQTNVKYEMTLQWNDGLYTGEIVNKSGKIRKDKKAGPAA